MSTYVLIPFLLFSTRQSGLNLLTRKTVFVWFFAQCIVFTQANTWVGKGIKKKVLIVPEILTINLILANRLDFIYCMWEAATVGQSEEGDISVFQNCNVVPFVCLFI